MTRFPAMTQSATALARCFRRAAAPAAFLLALSRVCFLTLLVLAIAPAARAGTFMGVDRDTGVPFHWQEPVPLAVDSGTLGRLSNAQARATVQAAADEWTAIATSALRIDVTSDILPTTGPEGFGDVASLSQINQLTRDGWSAVYFDTDGSILASMGLGASVLAVGGFMEPTTNSAITQGYIIAGGLGMSNYTTQTIRQILAHEMGHLVGLGHTIIGQDYMRRDGEGFVYGPDGAPLGRYDGAQVALMFWLLVAQNPGIRHIDDLSIISTLYPAGPDTLSGYGSIQGRLLDIDGVTPRTGGWMIARNWREDPLRDAVAVISGDRVGADLAGHPRRGAYEIHLLTPGDPHSLEVQSTHTNGSYRTEVFTERDSLARPSLGPLPGPEEYFSGPDEANTQPPDDPAAGPWLFHPGAGGPTAPFEADIVLNGAQIRGHVRDGQGAPLPEGRIQIDPDDRQAPVGPDGAWEVLVSNAWSGAVRPVLEGYRFEPDRLAVENLTGVLEGIDFIGAPTSETVRLSGWVLRGGVAPIAGASVATTDGLHETTSDWTGAWALNVPWNWSGAVAARHDGHVFEPDQRDYVGVTTDLDEQNFTETADAFEAAAEIHGERGTVWGSNANATKQPGEPNHISYDPGGKSVWWKWKAPRTGRYFVHLHGSDFDTVLAVYTGRLGEDLSLVEANDDDGSEDHQGMPWVSGLTFPARAGVVYHIVVDGFMGNDGIVTNGPIRLSWGPADRLGYVFNRTRGSASTINLQDGEVLHPGYPGQYNYLSSYQGGDFDGWDLRRFYAASRTLYAIDVLPVNDPIGYINRDRVYVRDLRATQAIVDMTWRPTDFSLWLLARDEKASPAWTMGPINVTHGQFSARADFDTSPGLRLLNLAADSQGRLFSVAWDEGENANALVTLTPGAQPLIETVAMLGDIADAISPMDYDPVSDALLWLAPDPEGGRMVRIDPRSGAAETLFSVGQAGDVFSAFGVRETALSADGRDWRDHYDVRVHPRNLSYATTEEGLFLDGAARGAVQIVARPMAPGVSPAPVPRIVIGPGGLGRLHLRGAVALSVESQGPLRRLIAQRGYVQSVDAEALGEVRMSARPDSSGQGERFQTTIVSRHTAATAGVALPRAAIRLSGVAAAGLRLPGQAVVLQSESRKHIAPGGTAFVSFADWAPDRRGLIGAAPEARYIFGHLVRWTSFGAAVAVDAVETRDTRAALTRVAIRGAVFSLPAPTSGHIFIERPASVIGGQWALAARRVAIVARGGDVAPDALECQRVIARVEARLRSARLARAPEPLRLGGRLGDLADTRIDTPPGAMIIASGLDGRDRAHILRLGGDLGVYGQFLAGADRTVDGLAPRHDGAIATIATLGSRDPRLPRGLSDAGGPVIRGRAFVQEGTSPRLVGDTGAIREGRLKVQGESD